ncbi:MAG: tRNA 4-thiouridine(8) synthase ThiI [Methanoregula sp.]|nr:tRNA 4-thiouridine(8) synthase ThiI [Methanoregula sp.]
MKCVMVRYGELFLKSEPVKRHFIGLLMRNIKKALDSEGLPHKFDLFRGRMLVLGDEPELIAAVVSRVFGVVDVSVCTRTSNLLDDLSSTAIETARGNLKSGMSFAIRAKRQGVSGYTSQQMGEVIGKAVADHVAGSRVDLSHPDYEIFIEGRDVGGFVYDRRIEAHGGLPLGTQGRVCVLLSSGIDSPVASWLAMKRGCEVTHLHMDGGRWAGPDVKEAAVENHRRLSLVENHRRLSLWSRGFSLPLLVMNSAPLYDAMEEHRIPPRNRCVICKRFMIRAGSILVPRQHALALVTGDSLGQVASQTLSNVVVISDAAGVPVLRPLITYDKQETIDIARRIGTFDAHPKDLACRAVPRMPTTAAILEEIKECESEMDIDSIVAAAVKEPEVILAKDGIVIPKKKA